MDNQMQKNTPLTVIKLIWTSSWQSLWTGEKRTLPVALIGYGVLLIFVVAMLLYLNQSAQLTGQPQSVGQLSLPVVEQVVLIALLLLVANFITAALITRSYAWLTKDTQLANKAWHNAKRCFLQLFLAHAVTLGFVLGFEQFLIKMIVSMSDGIKFGMGIFGFLVYVTAAALLFLIYTAVVIEAMPLGKAVSQGFKLLKASWAFTISVLTLGILFPVTLLSSFLHIPYLNVIVGLFFIFAFYPFMLVLFAFANIFIYNNAQKKYKEKLDKSGVNITQA